VNDHRISFGIRVNNKGEHMVQIKCPIELIFFELIKRIIKELMRRCVQEAVEIVKEVNTISWHYEDVRAISLSLFIQRTRG
jgi:hypothetical protein